MPTWRQRGLETKNRFQPVLPPLHWEFSFHPLFPMVMASGRYREACSSLLIKYFGVTTKMVRKVDWFGAEIMRGFDDQTVPFDVFPRSY